MYPGNTLQFFSKGIKQTKIVHVYVGMIWIIGFNRSQQVQKRRKKFIRSRSDYAGIFHDLIIAMILRLGSLKNRKVNGPTVYDIKVASADPVMPY